MHKDYSRNDGIRYDIQLYYNANDILARSLYIYRARSINTHLAHHRLWW
jgi:hypothetical protein